MTLRAHALGMGTVVSAIVLASSWVGSTAAPAGSPAGRQDPIIEVIENIDGEGEPAIRELAVSARLVDDDDPWSMLFGASPRRTMMLTVANVGNVPITDATLSLTVGRSDPPNGLIESLPLGDFAPREGREIEVPVELPRLAWGRHYIQGEISGATDPVTVTASTATYPWVLFIPLALVTHVILLLLRIRIRRRTLTDEPPMEGSAGVAPVGPAPTPTILAVGDPPLAPDIGNRSPTDETEVGSDLVYVVEIDEARTGAQSFAHVDRSLLARIVHEHHDEHLRRSVYTVLGLRATKQLIAAAMLRTDPSEVVSPPGRGVVDVVAVPQIVTAEPWAIAAASRELGRWLGDELHVPVHLAGPGQSVGEAPDLGARHAETPAIGVRLEAGVPKVSYGIVVDAHAPAGVDDVVNGLRAEGVDLLADHGRNRSTLLIRSPDLDALHHVHERVANRFRIEQRSLVGLIPLDMLTNVEPARLRQLGIGPSDSFEFRLIALAESRAIRASGRPPSLTVPAS
jgi:hypothetical protein